ncbi:Integrase catalytic domain-containing protein [Abeliophyllum distichum]|uniref:Integrase catalytic domain-containing protein n=1 Tax=Abeliophyllum distichum TaxID=126358 RepID=A0ABD1RVV2_9LAMI
MCDELGIHKHFSTLYYPQANGQMEVVDKTLNNILRRKLDSAKGTLADDWPQILWAYHTTIQTLTRETLFLMAYGAEAMVPIEVGLFSSRRLYFDEEQNNEAMGIEKDLLYLGPKLEEPEEQQEKLREQQQGSPLNEELKGQ